MYYVFDKGSNAEPVSFEDLIGILHWLEKKKYVIDNLIIIEGERRYPKVVQEIMLETSEEL